MNSVRKMVARFGIHPRKRLGQCFLEDLNIARRIAAIADPAADETVVEIGAGLGFMTEELARRAGRVIAIEIDPRLSAILQERFSGQANVEIVPQDVLDYDFSSALPGGRIKVVGNVPYNISTPILFSLLSHRLSIRTIVLMVQKELADRIAAAPGTKEYGIPSVLVARYARVSQQMTVPPGCFYPVPDVVSSVLKIEIAPEPQDADAELFGRIVRAAFARRRKTLWNNLRALGLPDDAVARALAASGIDRARRAETLSVDEFARLAAAWGREGTEGAAGCADGSCC